MRALASNAIWTSAAARDAGYDAPSVCSLCGQHDDALWHRLRQCPACAAGRERFVPEDIIALALDTESEQHEHTLFVHGAFRHPGDDLPNPAADGVVRVGWSVPEALPPGRPGPVKTHLDL
eukprot:6189710-Pyramimonas_sp.AAC.1